MREIVDTPDEDSNSETATPDVHGALLLGADTPSSKEEVLWPDPIQVLRLWQVFLDRVNPLTKIIHVPSLWPHVAEAANNSCNIPKNVEALLYAIFLMAVVSLTPDECREQLGQSREEALQRYSLGAQQSLYRMKFLKCLDLTTLQAYVLYLVQASTKLSLSHYSLTGVTDVPPRPLQPARRMDSKRRCPSHRSKDGVTP
jgi:hypothetical protein